MQQYHFHVKYLVTLFEMKQLFIVMILTLINVIVSMPASAKTGYDVKGLCKLILRCHLILVLPAISGETA